MLRQPVDRPSSCDALQLVFPVFKAVNAHDFGDKAPKSGAVRGCVGEGLNRDDQIDGIGDQFRDWHLTRLPEQRVDPPQGLKS